MREVPETSDDSIFPTEAEEAEARGELVGGAGVSEVVDGR